MSSDAFYLSFILKFQNGVILADSERDSFSCDSKGTMEQLFEAVNNPSMPEKKSFPDIPAKNYAG